MADPPTNREMVARARRAAEIIVERGKATGTFVDSTGRVCALGALQTACGGGLPYPEIIYRMRDLVPTHHVSKWNDLSTTTEHDIAAVFLKVADVLDFGGAS